MPERSMWFYAKHFMLGGLTALAAIGVTMALTWYVLSWMYGRH